MAIILFTNAFAGNPSDKIAINSDKIISVFEILDPDDKKKKNSVHEWASIQIERNGLIEMFNVVLMIAAIVGGIYLGWKESGKPYGMFLSLKAQDFGAWVRSIFAWLWSLL